MRPFAPRRCLPTRVCWHTCRWNCVGTTWTTSSSCVCWSGACRRAGPTPCARPPTCYWSSRRSDWYRQPTSTFLRKYCRWSSDETYWTWCDATRRTAGYRMTVSLACRRRRRHGVPRRRRRSNVLTTKRRRQRVGLSRKTTAVVRRSRIWATKRSCRPDSRTRSRAGRDKRCPDRSTRSTRWPSGSPRDSNSRVGGAVRQTSNTRPSRRRRQSCACQWERTGFRRPGDTPPVAVKR